MKPTLDSIFYSTVFGSGSGAPNISPTAFMVDTCQNVYVAGWGTSNSIFTTSFNPIFGNDMHNMPLTNDAFQNSTDGTDFYFFVMSKNAQSLLYGSYFGGPGYEDHVDGGTSRFDKRGVMYQAICAGCAVSIAGNSLTPSTPGAWSTVNRSYNCNELGLKIAFNLSATQVSVNAYPRATGCVPLRVQFQSTVNNIQSLEWYFGDGDSSNQFNPVHVYNDTGTYRVMLIGYNPNSCNEHDTAFISVYVRNDSLVANFAPNTLVNCAQSQITVVSHNYPTTHYSWNFGDNQTSTLDSVTHHYTAPGNYTVTLIVTDTTKCNLADTFQSVVNIPPQFNATVSTTGTRGCIPLTVNFSTPSTASGHYYWDFGDGHAATGSPTETHTYTTAGTWHAQVIVIDSTSCNISDTANVIVTTIDSSADASFQFQRQFYGCDSVLVTLWSAYAGETFELWDFGDGTQIQNTDTVQHMYRNAGTFTITHVISDPSMVCHPLDTEQVAVSLTPLHISISLPDTGGCLPFTGNFTGNSALLSTNFYWFFGDGDSTSGKVVNHTFTRTGTYRVRVIAIDTNACVGADSAFATVTVINDSTIAAFQMNILHDCDSNLQVTLTNQSTNAVNYLWTFGDGTSSTQQNESHTYTVPGTYTIRLIATDTTRCHPVDSMIKTVQLKPNAFVGFTNDSVCRGNNVTFTNLSNPNASFVWHYGDNSISGQFAPPHLFARAGTYTVTLVITDTATCNLNDTATGTVVVFEQPIAGILINHDSVKFETPVTFTSNSIYYDHLIWDLGDGTTVRDETSVTHVYETIGTVKVCLTASNGNCVDTACKNIFITYSELIGVPNAFSPNGDGINDVVKVEGKGIVELTFRIFNRWGELVFESHDKNVGWDGTYKNVLQEVDVYTYTVDAVLINGKRVPLKGNITLLR